ncbi:sugar ABC transporter permease [Devosia oryziradicis]|jgi:glucose/mannose transport system permease protein|uniref:Sugar ABC transporter permease n=1 Tax=Devosia oryziradicis TaxID=2801335 RepID=A0ABX7BW77_9HYPH|nr:sugar ABC transporter permease [Devosia oryziradicis]QQR35289.1 sugar ABC transporter permease [Devosia oryziradicis]
MAQLATANEGGAVVKTASSSGRKPFRITTLMSVIGTLPLILTAVGVFVICIIYSFVLSFTNSRIFPAFGPENFVGTDQYSRLWATGRWLVSVNNLWFFGLLSIVANMTAGYLLAVFMDQRIKAEDWFRSIFLYPFAMSLVITGLVWRWILDPNYGIQATVRGLGFTDFTFAPLVNASTAIYGLVVAGIWNGVGVTMAIMLAGLRGVDAEIWKAAKIDGIPTWRTYLFIVLPMMRGAILTAFILQCVGVVRVFDLVVAMTQGGPGIATQMPAVFVIQHITDRSNVGLGMAAATMMLLPVVILLGVQAFAQWRANKAKGY